MTGREEHLKTLGYQEPLDESPIDTPEGFHGGAVVNTGGNIMCRCWRTWNTSEKGNEFEYEVAYDVSQGRGVALEKFRYNEEAGYYEHLETVETDKAKYHSDFCMAKVAKRLMRIANRVYR